MKRNGNIAAAKIQTGEQGHNFFSFSFDLDRVYFIGRLVRIKTKQVPKAFCINQSSANGSFIRGVSQKISPSNTSAPTAENHREYHARGRRKNRLHTATNASSVGFQD